MIIDFHTHTFPEKIASRVADSLSNASHSVCYIEPSMSKLIESSKDAGIDYAVNLPVTTRPDQVVSINDSMIDQTYQLFEQGIVLFGGIHPDYADYKTELKRLKENGIKGIKIHPAYQGCNFNDIKYKRILDAASELELVVVTHAGKDIGFLPDDYASVDMILDVIKDVHPTGLVLAHMGGWQGWDQVSKYLAGADVYFDTSFSIGKIRPKEGHEDLLTYSENMSIKEFAVLCKKHGTDKILFATDSPWDIQQEYIDFVNESEFTEKERDCIFGENARMLLNI